MSRVTFAVLGGGLNLDRTLEWFAGTSDGVAQLGAIHHPLIEPVDGWGAFARQGGQGSPPGNSQQLAETLLDAAGRGNVPEAASGVLIFTPPEAGFLPHAWRFRKGGYWLGGREWSRRYAVVPSDAPTGTVAHELGHLLFNWPDHRGADAAGTVCLMGRGGWEDPPSPPCARCRIDAGWSSAEPVGPHTRVAQLTGGRVFSHNGTLIERGAGGDVVFYEGGRLVGRLSAADNERLLALWAKLTPPRRDLAHQRSFS